MVKLQNEEDELIDAFTLVASVCYFSITVGTVARCFVEDVSTTRRLSRVITQKTKYQFVKVVLGR